MLTKTILEKTMIYCLIAILAIFTNCQRQDKSSSSDLHISFKVDSIKIYDAKNIAKDIFMFSPLGNKDKIWTVNTLAPQELDLITGEWKPLTARFGNAFNKQIREEDIWKDGYTGETYISCFHDGLVRYYPQRDTFDFLEIHPVTSLYPRKENIVLGTANGLYFLNRNDNKISVAKNFPLDVWVKSIREWGKDTLLINDTYYYVISSNAVREVIVGASTSEQRTNNNSISQEVGSKLPGYGGGFREFTSESTSWYYTTNELFFSTNKVDFYKFPAFPQGLVRHMLDDKEYLYVLFDDRFVILNKDYVRKNSLIHDVAKYQKLRQELEHKMAALNESKMEFEQYLAKSIALYHDQKYSSYADLQNALQNLPSRLESYSFQHGAGNSAVIFEKDTIPKVFKYHFLKGLCRKYTRSVKVDSALIYFHLIQKLDPSKKDYCIDACYPCVVSAKDQFDSINSKRLSADRVLFLEAKVMEKLIQCSCSCWDNYCDFSMVEEKYKAILAAHPHSEFADDAAYWMLNYQKYQTEEGVYSESQIPTIRKFVRAYPNSTYLPELLIDLADSYSGHYVENIDDRIKNIEKAIGELSTLKKNYRLDSSQLARVEHNLNQFEQQKNELIFTLTVIPSKSQYQLNEDIEVEITLSNNSSTPKTLELYANESYVSFGIHPDSKVKFIPIANADVTKKKFKITRGEPLQQKVKINRLVRHWDGGKLGRFNFEEEGLYYLTCFSREHRLDSKQVKIYVKK